MYGCHICTDVTYLRMSHMQYGHIAFLCGFVSTGKNRDKVLTHSNPVEEI